MRRIKLTFYSIVFSACGVFFPAIQSGAEEPRPVGFLREVAPILVGKCQGCHGPKTAEGNYRIDTFQALMQPGDSGSAPIAAGDLENSDIHRLITAEDADERMPNNGDRLTDSEINLIKTWILQGAKFDGQDVAAPLRDQIPRDIAYSAAPESYPTALPITAMAFNADGKQLLVGGYHEVLIWDSASGALIQRVGNVPQRTFGMALSPDGAWLAVAGGAPGVSGEVRLIPWQEGPKWDAAPKVLASLDDVFFDVAFRPDGLQLAAGGADGCVRVFEVGTGVQRLKIESHADWVTDICYSPDGKTIGTASRDKTAKIFDAETGALLTTHSEHNAPARAIAFGPDSKTVLSAGGSGIHIWSIEDPKTVGEMAGFGKDIYALQVSGDTVIAVSADRSARQFKLADRTLIRSFDEHPGWLLSLAWHALSHRIATGSFDGTVTIWNLEDGAKLKQFLALPAPATQKP